MFPTPRIPPPERIQDKDPIGRTACERLLTATPADEKISVANVWVPGEYNGLKKAA